MTQDIRKYIRAIRLYRFQSYADETIILDPKTNALVGPTDSGKSAISRALYWTLYNRPIRVGRKGKGDEFTTWGEKHCFVTIFFSDGTEITRGRKDSENYYVLRKPNGDIMEFKGFGFEVPPEIITAHGMTRLEFDDGVSMSLNVSQQLESIFLFDDSSSKRAKTIGKISGADKTDGALDIIQAWHREAGGNRKTLKNSIKELDAKIADYDFVADLGTALNTLEEILNNISGVTALHDNLFSAKQRLEELYLDRERIFLFLAYENKLIQFDDLLDKLVFVKEQRDKMWLVLNKYLDLKKQRDMVNKLLNNEYKLNEVSDVLQQLQVSQRLITNIKTHLEDYLSAEEQVAETVFTLNHSDTLDTVAVILDTLNDKLSYLENINVTLNEYILLKQRVNNGYNFLSELEENIKDMGIKYKEYLMTTKECPFCTSPITGELIDRLEI